MPVFRIPFRKMIRGYMEVTADSLEDAKRFKIDEELGEYEEDIRYIIDEENAEDVTIATQPIDDDDD